MPQSHRVVEYDSMTTGPGGYRAATLPLLDRRWTVSLIDWSMTEDMIFCRLVCFKEGPTAHREACEKQDKRVGGAQRKQRPLLGARLLGAILNWNAQNNQWRSHETDVADAG